MRLQVKDVLLIAQVGQKWSYLPKKEGGEPIVLCDKIAQQIPPPEDGRHGVCETTERQPGPLNKKGVQASKKRKREHKRVLDRFAHRPFQPITCPSLTILEITSLRDVLCVICAKSDACVAPKGGYYRSSVPNLVFKTRQVTSPIQLGCTVETARNQGFQSQCVLVRNALGGSCA